MYKLRLIKALSYSGIVCATKDNPFVIVEDEAIANEAVASGYFELVTNDNETASEEEDTNTPAEHKAVADMTVSELETFASANNISLKGISKKADMIAKINEELSAKDDDYEINYGSPTMTELQD